MINKDKNHFQPDNKRKDKQTDNLNLSFDSVNHDIVNEKNNADNLAGFSGKEISDNLHNSEYIHDFLKIMKVLQKCILIYIVKANQINHIIHI